MPISAQLIEAILLTCLDSNPIDFSRVDEAEVDRAKRAILRAGGPTHGKFRGPMSRKHFLCACLDLTENSPEEHLIVGYGHQYRNTTLIERIHHIVGEQRSVAIPPFVQLEMKQHHFHRSSGEVIVFHNHPRTGFEPEWFYVLKALILDHPIASVEDRVQMQRYAFNALGIARQALGQGSIRFFLGESGYVKEFRLPLISPFLAQLNSLQDQASNSVA